VENLERCVGGPINFRREQFERLGLKRTMDEPMRVYCKRCGAEIDPWRAFAKTPEEWWRCPWRCDQKPH
jgi:hypothetical protein